MYTSLIQPVLWALTIAGAVALTGRSLWVKRKRGKPSRRALLAATGLATAAALVVPAVGVVPAGYRGVVYEWSGGVNPSERGEGITLLVPWIQHMQTTSVRTQKVYSDKVFSQSSDLQEITVVASVNYHVDPSRAAELYQSVGPDYSTVVIQPALFQRTKTAIGKVKAEGFALNRSKLAETIQGQLSAQLSRYGIIVEFVNIEDAIFDPAFVKAVKNKIIAEQKAAEQRRLIEAQRAIKEQTIIRAEAEARSVLIKANAQAAANNKLASSITPTLLRWRWLNEWDGTLPTTLVGEGPSLLLNVP